MKKYSILIIIVVSGITGFLTGGIRYQSHKTTITKLCQDGKYISITFIQDGKEYAYDYLTPKELKEFINTGSIKR